MSAAAAELIPTYRNGQRLSREEAAKITFCLADSEPDDSPPGGAPTMEHPGDVDAGSPPVSEPSIARSIRPEPTAGSERPAKPLRIPPVERNGSDPTPRTGKSANATRTPQIRDSSPAVECGGFGRVYQPMIAAGLLRILSETELRAYVAIAAHVNSGTGTATISTGRIANLIGRDERTARRAVAALVKKNAVEADRRGGRCGETGIASTFRLITDPARLPGHPECPPKSSYPDTRRGVTRTFEGGLPGHPECPPYRRTEEQKQQPPPDDVRSDALAMLLDAGVAEGGEKGAARLAAANSLDHVAAAVAWAREAERKNPAGFIVAALTDPSKRADLDTRVTAGRDARERTNRRASERARETRMRRFVAELPDTERRMLIGPAVDALVAANPSANTPAHRRHLETEMERADWSALHGASAPPLALVATLARLAPRPKTEECVRV